jgi:pimeloyl-ACP methyl ester carboxylesterase
MVPMPERLRPAAPAARPKHRALASAACALLLAATAACSGGDGGGSSGGSRGGKDKGAKNTPSAPSTAALPKKLTGQHLAWKSCPAPAASEGGGSAPRPMSDGTAWQCATLTAPLDYDKPDGSTMGIALIRAKAGTSSKTAESSDSGTSRIGSLIFNFGGPGGSGVATLPMAATDYKSLHARYDLVSFDPRGVGRSKGVECVDSAEMDKLLAADATPDDRAERDALIADNKTFAEGCEKHSPAILPNLTTTDTARDLDLMRQVLGDKKLYYFGISYGTELGGVYAHLFPEQVGRSVLDAVVDPTQTPEQSDLDQTAGFQLALNNFLKDCASGGDCPVGEDPKAGVDEIVALLKELDRKPIPGIGGRKVTESIANSGIAAALYSEEAWPLLSEGLATAKEGDGRILNYLSDSMNERNDKTGRYSTLQSSFTAIGCADSSERYTTEDVESALPKYREASPVFGESAAWGLLRCTDWPVAGAAKHADVTAPGADPIVVIGNTGDPATPYAGAKKMAGQLGDGVGVLMTVKGEGHGAYNGSGSGCVKKAVDGYLLAGTVPRNGLTCE